jgi:ABC-2 type transport system ATP-binding protein
VSAICVSHLVKRYGAFAAVDDVSFEVPAGSIAALLGPNGAGKTTTIEILEGFTEPTSGVVRVLGEEPMRAGRRWRARIGLVLQSTSLDPQLTVREALRLYARLFPRPMPVAEVLATIDLTDDADTRIGVLSGGQRRRVDLGLGIVGRPKVLFLDEPTTGLDPEARRGLWAGVQNLVAGGTTVLLTTHYLDEAQQLADRVLVLDEGRVVADSTPDELRARFGGAMIRYRVPASAPLEDLPPGLAAQVDADRELVVRHAQVTDVVGELYGWAQRHGVDLNGLEVGSPSLEDVYLALTSEPPVSEGASHA